MTLREVLLAMTKEQRAEYAAAAGTTAGYLRKLAYGQCLPSGALARKLIENDPRLTYVDLFERGYKKKGA